MPERPEDTLTDEEIEQTAATPAYTRPTGRPGEPVSPWNIWAPAVLGATILHLRNAIRDLDLFTTALIENEGTGFSCTEIEEYCRLLEVAGMEADAAEVRKGHAAGDEDGDFPEHLALWAKVNA